MSEEKQKQKQETKEELERLDSGAMVGIGFDSEDSFELTQRASTLLSKSDLVPSQFKKSVSNCFIALNMSHRMKADPLMVMQNLNIIKGKPTFSSQFLISCFNIADGFSKLRYEFKGERDNDDWGCRAYATEIDTGEVLKGTWITIKMAKKEGWYGKKGSKWKTMPEQMLRYRAAAFFIRTHAPEISMGMHTTEEIADIDAKQDHSDKQGDEEFQDFEEVDQQDEEPKDEQDNKPEPEPVTETPERDF